MKPSKPAKRKGTTLDRWSGIFTTLLILMLIVIALMVVVIRLPIESASLSLGATLTLTPVTTDPLPLPPPIVDTTGIVVMGGLLMLLVLGIVLRELTWFRRQP
jgi:hypothetical protein